MNAFPRRYFIAGIILSLSVCYAAGQAATSNWKTHYLITDDSGTVNTVTFYKIGPLGNLSRFKTVPTGGTGGVPNYFAAKNITGTDASGEECAYVADIGSSDIAGVNVQSQEVTGNFKGSSGDDGGLDMSLAMNRRYLYAAFAPSRTIATFAVQPGCKLEFVSSIANQGLNGGAIDGMAVTDKAMVVAYADGSIQSFDISGGVPVPNDDQQLSTGYMADGGKPAGVTITGDGHFAIFGDAAGYVEIEVSDISSGGLSPTIEYGGAGGQLGPGDDSNNVRLSSDESLLYISVTDSGEVAAAFFDKETGAVSKGCDSGPLRGYRQFGGIPLGIAARAIFGEGDEIFVAEGFSHASSHVGMLDVDSHHGHCKLTERRESPVSDPQGRDMGSIRAF